MITTRFTPRVLAVGLAFQLVLLVALDALAQLGWTPRLAAFKAIVIAAGGVFAYSVALVFNLRSAAEYRGVRCLYIAWLALAANAGLSIFRSVLNSSRPDFLIEGDLAGAWHGLLEHLLVVPANTLLLVGVLAMWLAYHRIGLGFKVEPRDYGVMIGFLSLMISILIFREGLTEARSPYILGRYLQGVGLVLISIVGMTSIVLHRLAMQMDGGQLALALRWLTIYVILRNILVLAGTLRYAIGPEFTLLNQSLLQLTDIFWPVVPWTFALAAAHHAQLTVHAAKTLEQQRAARAALASA